MAVATEVYGNRGKVGIPKGIAKRGPGRPFEPGNPGGGRPKGAKSITTRVREAFTSGKVPEEIVASLKELCSHQNASIRLAAIREVMDRSDGRAQENVNLTGDVEMNLKDMAAEAAGRKAVVWVRRHHPEEYEAFLKAIGIG